jgi:Rab3 GTPase-activating protein catalytic subunit
MLNCCIERKKAREMSSVSSRSQPNSGTIGAHRSASISSEDDNEEEFFECVEDNEKPVEKGESAGGEEPVGWTDTSLESSSVFADTESSFQAEGRLKPHGNMKLLNVDEPLYVPITQEPAPMTEDMLEEHAEVLAR